MGVAGLGLAYVLHAVASAAQAVGKIGILVVHEQVLTHPTQLTPGTGANRAGPAANAKHFRAVMFLLGWGQPGAVIAVTAGIYYVAGGVD